MRRLIKWLGFALLVLLFLSAAVLGGAYYYKSEILAAINEELKESINGDFSVGGITFGLWDESPGLSITLHDIYLRGPQYGRFRADFFKAKKVNVNVRLAPLLSKTIVVRSIHIAHGSIFIFRTHTGYTNMDVFKSAKNPDTIKTENPVLVMFRKVRLEDVQFTYQDSLKKKSIGFNWIDLHCQFSQSDSTHYGTLAGPMRFDGLMFNPANGSFLKEKNARVQWDLEFHPASKRLTMKPSTLEFSQSTVTVSGVFDFAAPGNLHLNVSSDKLDYSEGVSLLTQALQEKLAKIKIEKPIKVTTRVYGQFAVTTPPEVDITFQFSNSKIEAFAIAAEKVTAEGSFSNHVDSTRLNDDSNSMVKLNSFEGMFQGLPTRLTATIHDLKDPQVDLTSTMEVNLKNFKTLVDSSTVKFYDGTFTSRVEYSGRLNEFLDSTKTKFKGTVKGTARLKDGSFRYVPRKQAYEKVNATVSFAQDHVSIEGISFTVNKSPVSLKGEVIGFVPFLVLPEKKGWVKVSVYSPSLDLASLMLKEPPKKVTTQRKLNAKKKGTELFDMLSEKIQFDLTVQLDRLSYQNIKGSNVKGTVVRTHNTLEGQNFTMNLAGGDIAFSLRLADLQKPVNPLAITSNVRHADIKKFFYSFNNFKLTTITYENLEGTIDMKSTFWANVDGDFNVAMPSVYSDVDFSIKDGKLLNFEPLQNMSNFLFKKRDFNNVQFGEIRSHLTVRGTEIDIRKMEVESNVLRLFVEGRYSLKDNTNLEVQVPLSNLKKRDKDYVPENVGVDSKVGPSVFLHVYTDDKGKTVIAYDPFKKHAKKHAEKKPKGKASKKNK